MGRAAQSADTSGAWPFSRIWSTAFERLKDGAIPYSIVTGVEPKMLEWMQHDKLGHMSGCDATLPAGMGTSPETAHLPPLILNQWAGSDLQAKLGERVTLDYYFWQEGGRLETRRLNFAWPASLRWRDLRLTETWSLIIPALPDRKA